MPQIKLLICAMDNKLAIVIPVCNNWPYTKRAIHDLSFLPGDHKLFIIDNGSSDETKNLNSSGKIYVIRNVNNDGFGAACNKGFDIAKNKFENVMFLNNDIGVFANYDTWTSPLIASAQKGYIVGPTAGCLDDNFGFVGEGNKFPTRGYGYISGWNITASTETWNKLILDGDIGPFSSLYFSYFEDTDLSFRAKKLGIELKLIPVPVRHIGRVTGKKLGLPKMYEQSKKTFLELWGNK
jgi:GT2 family glycosyltransferase